MHHTHTYRRVSERTSALYKARQLLHVQYQRAHVQNLYILPTLCIYVFCMDLSIKWLIFIVDMQCVYCVVRI